ncbi:sigma-70 family RNA polymerase sigma factor [Aurantiacibacter luteus]|uniref:RNA polymerase subunit sigma n=1 Tax=Aurantiacibacter luteus TaxID=1581420 RepID=A0A0G9MPM3_9SPHN|nr:sigma-70 family RNA polymerase sigma factor [Aurantiacibacter luteus]KLE31243.1 hypothetical protein AAW00_13835 [Aurantiacibacter luteus]
MKQDHARFQAAQAYAAPDVVERRVRAFIPLVRKLAWHIHGGGRPGIEVDDLMQAGLLALTECARRHSGTGEDGFAAYAKMRVRGAMYDLLRKTIPDGRVTARKRALVGEVRRQFIARTGHAPSMAELAEATGMSARDLLEADIPATRIESLDASYADADPAFADEAPDAFEVLSAIEESDRLAEMIAVLPDRLKLTLQLYFVEELNLSEIAEILEVSIPRVHQLKAKALALLRDACSGHRDDVLEC